MQVSNLLISEQSIDLFEQSIRNRLEQYAFSVQVPLTYYKQSGQQFNAESTDNITNHLEVTLIELRYLVNELQLLQQLKSIE